MGIITGVLQMGLLGKTLDLMSFVFRTHVMNRLEAFGQLRKTIQASKRRFMAGDDDDAPRS
jgi:hypothetical protein